MAIHPVAQLLMPSFGAIKPDVAEKMRPRHRIVAKITLLKLVRAPWPLEEDLVVDNVPPVHAAANPRALKKPHEIRGQELCVIARGGSLLSGSEKAH